MTSMTSRVTGIQRVVRNIVRHGRAAAAGLGMECVPVRFVGGSFCFAGPLACVPGVAAAFRLATRSSPRRKKGRPGKSSLDTFKRGSLRAIGRRISRASEVAIGAGGPVDWAEGDILLLADASWEMPLWFAVSQAQAQGVSIGTIQYDLIPILHPEMVPEGLVTKFTRWMDKAVHHTDFFLAISENVRHQMRTYATIAARETPRCGDRIVSFPLGSDIETVVDGKVRRGVQVPFERCDGRGTYIVVGTIETRKNQQLALQAFELLWRRSCAVSLVVIGRPGHGSQPLIDHIQAHPQNGEHLFLVEDASDAELQWCYRHARALVFPSKAEGFGLPIVEAMQQGLPVFASDIPAHHEVGRSHCRFFDPTNPFELAHLVETFEGGAESAPSSSWDANDFPHWKDCVSTLFKTALECAEDASQHDVRHDVRRCA